MWYHGSKKLFPVLKRKKARGAPADKPLENLSAIYFTPDYPFALALAARTRGCTRISWSAKTIQFGNPEEFDPEEEVYIYIIDPSKIPEKNKIWVDEKQVAVDLDEIEPEKVERHKAGEVSQHYSIIP